MTAPGVEGVLAEVLDVHRWRSMGVSSVQCECGEIVYGPDSLTQFPADEAFRNHVAAEQAKALAVWAQQDEVVATVARALHGHLWGVEFPDDEADCCGVAALAAILSVLPS